MTQTHAAAVAALLAADYAAEGAALTPARAVATVAPQIGYDNLAYDIVVNYSDSVSVTEPVVEEGGD